MEKAFIISLDDFWFEKATKKQKEAAKKWKLSETTREKIRQSKREDMPASWFLDSENKRYPIQTRKGKPERKLLVAAYRRAIMQKEPLIAEKARRLLKKYYDIEFKKPEQAK